MIAMRVGNISGAQLTRLIGASFFEVVQGRGWGYGAANAIFRIAALRRYMRPAGMQKVLWHSQTLKGRTMAKALARRSRAERS